MLKEIISVRLKVFQKAEDERTFPNAFCEASITIIPWTENDIARKKTTNQ